MFNRGVVVGVAGAVALIGPSLSPAVAASHVAHKHRISETGHLANVASRGKAGTPSFRLISAGIFDGKLGSRSISGAIRASVAFTTPGHNVVHGTEFDVGGSRRFVIHSHYVVANGIVTERGRGSWIGGTGRYVHARGTFTINGRGPLTGAVTVRQRGSIIY